MKIKIVLSFLLGAIIFSSISVYAYTILNGDEVIYDNTNSNLNSTNVQDAIDELYEKADKSGCDEKGELVTFKVGDYVKMSPNPKEAILTTAGSGYTSEQIVNPSELNLWRVIHLNSDKTVSMVSEYVSSQKIYFSGMVGYQYYIWDLNALAGLYENGCYTTGSRYMGYNAQTTIIRDTSKLSSTTAPWASTTTGTVYVNEVLGGGDTLHSNDITMVKAALGTLIAYEVGTTTPTDYWLASRHYGYGHSTSWSYYGRIIDTLGEVNVNASTGFWNMRGNLVGATYGNALRPIVHLKYGIKAEGSGTAEDPYILN